MVNSSGDAPRRRLIQTHGFTLKQKLEFYSMPEPNSGCLLWLGQVNNWGYGVLSWRGRTHGAHRLSFMEAFGPIDANLVVCHKCDVPGCINPDHLFLGTHADNMADRDRKGRRVNVVGERHGKAKITDADVEAIRSSPLSSLAIAPRFGISDRHVRAIRTGKFRSHVG